MPSFDEFVPDPKVAREFGITLMTMWRWDKDPTKAARGWPPPMRASTAKNGRKSRSRQQLEQFKANLIQRALGKRNGAAAA
jgi:hypothetical protein